MSDEKAFRKTGAPAASKPANTPATPDSDFMMLEPREQLRQLIAHEMDGKAFCELAAVTFDHRGASMVGHILLDTLEEQGYSVDDFDAVGALTAAAVPLVCAMIQAAASRGENLDGFVMDFVYPSIKGPSIKGKRVILLDSWLSEKSYVQTSSLVTLRNGNELSLDFGVVEHEGATVVAIASLIGGVDMTDPTIKVINPVNGEEHELPFVEIFHESELR
ncbi:pyrE Orotate phosphoribosyltransferase [Bifidobacterium goeldii]|uniref:PyrE Orotate phosphoribosyltransferase n=1 Tax=Bifidobacterium goeldii TaxID=2306975 RepID=A0A430FCN3_9BIFI|nr:orotate phosphoribosyltransferase [Bifidobacterium goeldii]RSX50596.1 pyrE Orotate phosphoribosyltransferase [Bifidobacterium goeldii]